MKSTLAVALDRIRVAKKRVKTRVRKGVLDRPVSLAPRIAKKEKDDAGIHDEVRNR